MLHSFNATVLCQRNIHGYIHGYPYPRQAWNWRRKRCLINSDKGIYVNGVERAYRSLEDIPGIMWRFFNVSVGGRALETTPVVIPVQHGTRIAGRPTYQLQTLTLGQSSLSIERLYLRYPAFYIHRHSITKRSRLKHVVFYQRVFCSRTFSCHIFVSAHYCKIYSQITGFILCLKVLRFLK